MNNISTTLSIPQVWCYSWLEDALDQDLTQSAFNNLFFVSTWWLSISTGVPLTEI